MTAVNKEDLVATIKWMRDIDGYRSGDCISRKAVLALIDALEEIDLSALDDDLK